MKRCPKSGKIIDASDGLSRRGFLGGAAASGLIAGWMGCGRADTGAQRVAVNRGGSGARGPFSGRVIEIGHAGAVSEGRRDPVVVKAMIEQGMSQLVPEAETPVDAWRYFFQKGDRVGIKVVPVGKSPKNWVNPNYEGPVVDLKRPGSVSSYEVVHEIVSGLASAGVALSDILVFERYRNEIIQTGYLAMLPDGVHWEGSSVAFDQTQLEIDGQVRGERKLKNVAGYDRDVYRELAICQPETIHHPDDDRRFRSHLSKIVTQKVDKIINIPVLKDHRTGGVTLALKNMSHGMVNNVARSHINGIQTTPSGESDEGTLNHCQTFIPAAASLGPTREKCVLQILDGLVGTYEGGPGAWNSSFATWEYNSLLFATDPVALDRVGWEIIDAKRALHGWPSVARMGLDSETGFVPPQSDLAGRRSSESFHIRQPQHIPLAGILGMGVFDRSKIEHQRIEMA